MFHCVMTGCLRCQGAHITAKEREVGGGGGGRKSGVTGRQTEVEGLEVIYVLSLGGQHVFFFRLYLC